MICGGGVGANYTGRNDDMNEVSGRIAAELLGPSGFVRNNRAGSPRAVNLACLGKQIAGRLWLNSEEEVCQERIISGGVRLLPLSSLFTC